MIGELVVPAISATLALLMMTSTAHGWSEVDQILEESSAAYYGQLTIGCLQPVDSMNPYVGLNDVSRMFYGLVYDCLVSVGDDLNITPNLARSWYPVPAEDPEMVGMPFGSVWQYNLTSEAEWSDGVPFTADDVVFNIWLNAGPSTYYDSWAYQPFAYFIESATKVDNNTVRISFWNRATGEPMPSAYAPFIPIPMLAKHMLDSWPYTSIHMDWTGVFSELQSPGMPIVGTGPFIGGPNIYNEWLQGDHMTLLRNPSYHQNETSQKDVKFNQMTIRFFQDETTMILALENGEIDVAAFSPSSYRNIENDVTSGHLKNVDVFDGPKATQTWTEVAFNMRLAGPNPSRLDPVIRQALHMATDKEYIVNNYYLGLGEAGSTLIPPTNTKWHYEPNASEKAKFALNLTAAADLLESSGYMDVDSDGIRECTISSPAVQLEYVTEGTKLIYEMMVRKEHPEEKDIALFLKAQWAEIGVDLKVLVLEVLTLSTVAYSYSYDTMIWDWSSDVDPNFQLFVVSSLALNGWSDCAYSNPDYNEAYLNSVAALDSLDRKAWVDEAQRIFYNDSAYIILTYIHQGYAWRTDTFEGWGNWSAHPGRNIDNYWSANPLIFDLVPSDQGPIPLYLTASPNPARAYQSVEFNISAISLSGRALTFTLDFGDGKERSKESAGGTTNVQYVHMTHTYTESGNYTLTVTIDDNSSSIHHSVTTELVEWMSVEDGFNFEPFVVLGGGFIVATGISAAVASYIILRKPKDGSVSAMHQQVPPMKPPAK